MTTRNERRAQRQQAEAEAAHVFTEAMITRINDLVADLIRGYSDRGACSHCLCKGVFKQAAGSLINGGNIDEVRAIVDESELEQSETAGSA